MTTQDSKKAVAPVAAPQGSLPIWVRPSDGHIATEFADFDVDATMETMVAEPYVHCVATLMGASAVGKSVAFTASTS